GILLAAARMRPSVVPYILRAINVITSMQYITDSWGVLGLIKASSDAWLKGCDERIGGNLTLRLDYSDISPFAANFHE
ncbi:hypothetical protein AIZ10_23235, partial [Salmonella enterica subsp. enterica serovar Typhimurium]